MNHPTTPEALPARDTTVLQHNRDILTVRCANLATAFKNRHAEKLANLEKTQKCIADALAANYGTVPDVTAACNNQYNHIHYLAALTQCHRAVLAQFNTDYERIISRLNTSNARSMLTGALDDSITDYKVAVADATISFEQAQAASSLGQCHADCLVNIRYQKMYANALIAASAAIIRKNTIIASVARVSESRPLKRRKLNTIAE